MSSGDLSRVLDDSTLDFLTPVPHNGSMTSTTATTWQTPYVPHWQANKLERWIKATTKWFALCNALSAARGTDAEPAALAAWQKGRMPSKSSKYQAYDNGRALERFLGLQTRANTVEELAEVLAAFRAQEGKQKA